MMARLFIPTRITLIETTGPVAGVSDPGYNAIPGPRTNVRGPFFGGCPILEGERTKTWNLLLGILFILRLILGLFLVAAIGTAAINEGYEKYKEWLRDQQ